MTPSPASQWPDPQAHWIRRRGSEAEKNALTHFVRVFDAPSRRGPLRLLAAANSICAIWLNGRLVGRVPGVNSPRRWYFHAFEIPADAIRPEGNVLAILHQHDGAATETIQGFQYGDPGLLASLMDADGAVVARTGDAGWKARRAPEFSPIAHLVSQWGGYREYYHGDREDGWREPGSKHADWDAAEVLGGPTDAGIAEALFALDVPPLEEEVVLPQRVVELRPNLGTIEPHADGRRIIAGPGEPLACPAVVFDFGAMDVGFPEIEVSGADCVFEVWYGESMDLARLDCVSRPNGKWSCFQRRAFRFLMVKFILLDGPVTLELVRLRRCWHAYSADRALESASPRWQEMVDVSIRTLRVGTSLHYEDCPWREQAAWVLDARIMGLINAYLFGDHGLNARSIRQSFAIQRPDGYLSSTGPRDNGMFHSDFPLHLAGMLREHFQHTGDAEIVREHAGQLELLDAFYGKLVGDDGLLDLDKAPHLPPPHLDWNNLIDRSGKVAILNALYKLFLEDRAFMERHALGRPQRAAEFDAAAAKAGASLREQFLLEGESLFADSIRGGVVSPTRSQQASYAALRAGIVEGAEARAVLDEVLRRDDLVKPFGPSFYLQIVEALDRVGAHDEMARIMEWYWGAMLDRGARTWWEVFNPETPANIHPHPFLGNCPTFEMEWIPISTCHGWSGIPGYAIPRFLLGVDLSGAWRKEIAVRPRLPADFGPARYRVRVGGEPLELRFEGGAVEVVAAPDGFQLILPEPAESAIP